MQRFYTYVTEDKDIECVRDIFEKKGFDCKDIVVDTMETRPELRRILRGKWKSGDELITDSLTSLATNFVTANVRVKKMQRYHIVLRSCDMPETLVGETDYDNIMLCLKAMSNTNNDVLNWNAELPAEEVPENFAEYYHKYMHSEITVNSIMVKTGLSQLAVRRLLRQYRDKQEKQ